MPWFCQWFGNSQPDMVYLVMSHITLTCPTSFRTSKHQQKLLLKISKYSTFRRQQNAIFLMKTLQNKKAVNNNSVLQQTSNFLQVEFSCYGCWKTGTLFEFYGLYFPFVDVSSWNSIGISSDNSVLLINSLLLSLLFAAPFRCRECLATYENGTQTCRCKCKNPEAR